MKKYLKVVLLSAVIVFTLGGDVFAQEPDHDSKETLYRLPKELKRSLKVVLDAPVAKGPENYSFRTAPCGESIGGGTTKFKQLIKALNLLDKEFSRKKEEEKRMKERLEK
jgi:hypothetical protein